MNHCKIMLLSALIVGVTVTAYSQAAESKNIKIEEIDKNFQSTIIGDKEVRYYNALKEPFVLTGFPWRDERLVFNRLPSSFTEKEVSGKVLSLSRLSTGGAIRFRTDSVYIALRAQLAYSSDMGHMPRAASSGFDFYRGSGADIRYHQTIRPGSGQTQLEGMAVPETPRRMNDWTIYLPLYGSASKIEVGLAPDAKLEEPTPQTIGKPVLFYGSSVTQGGCASRTGNAYTTMLCRAVDAPQVNLGFSGSAKGEIAIARAIATLELAAFVLDYEYNAPTLEHLRKTHEPFFKVIRGKHPNLPIIIMSKGNFRGTPNNIATRNVVRKTYENAVKAGDRKVWFVDGETLFGKEDRDACTVDGGHPNDLGFYRMYKTVLPVLKEAIGSGEKQ